VAGYGRRLVALFIDWVVALLTVSFIAAVAGWRLSRGNLWPLAAFGVETWLLTGLLGLTIGKRLLGLRVVRLDGRPVGRGTPGPIAARLHARFEAFVAGCG
jgi:uncharacterized RDD family membrane protein YckC